MPRSALVLAIAVSGLVLSACDGGRNLAASRHLAASMRPVGQWAGSANQYDSGDVRGTPDSQWTIELDLGETALVSYPSLGCSGTLTYRRQSPAGASVYTETITRGQDRCVASGTIELLPQGDRLQYSAHHESQLSVSVGVLTRR